MHRHSARGQGFSESSSYETREHFERKVQRVKKKGEARAVKAAEEVQFRAIKVGFGPVFKVEKRCHMRFR